MSLKEELSHKLSRAFNGEAERMNAEERATGIKWADRYPDPSHLWKVVADECIRQMEWARSEALKGEHWVDDPDEEGHRIIRDASELPLTLAPDGWTATDSKP